MVACCNEPTPELEDEIRMRFDMPMRAALAMPRSVQQAIAKYYAPGMRDEAVVDTPSKPTKSGKPAKAPATSAPKKQKSSSGPLSDEQKAQRKQISLILIMWSLIGTVMGIHLSGLMGTFGMFATGAVVAGTVAGILKLTYWK